MFLFWLLNTLRIYCNFCEMESEIEDACGVDVDGREREAFAVWVAEKSIPISVRFLFVLT